MDGSAHAPANGSPVFPETYLGLFFFGGGGYFYKKFKISTPLRNAQVWAKPVM